MQEIKPGYKQTEVGVIPEDWRLDSLGHVLTLQRGFDLPKRLRRRGPVPIVTSSGIEDFHNQAAAKGPGIITGRYGTIGKVHFVETEYWPLNTTLWVRDFHGNDPRWGYRVLQTVDFLSHSGKSGVPGVNRNDVHGELVLVPTLPEQRAIAAALADADSLIAALEGMIAKKRDLKQAAMQHLLTGRTRLPGFSGEWEVKRLGDLGSFLKGRGISRDQAQSGDIPCVRYGEIYTVHHDVIRSFASRISREVAETATPIRYGDLLFAGSGETKEEIGKCVALGTHAEAYAGGDIVILRPKVGDPFFLGYLMNTSSVVRQKANFGQGDAVVHISARALANIEITLPDPTEQTAIAEVLSDIDADLAALEAQAAKARAVKQGMMQELLTGRVRLV